MDLPDPDSSMNSNLESQCSLETASDDDPGKSNLESNSNLEKVTPMEEIHSIPSTSDHDSMDIQGGLPSVEEEPMDQDFIDSEAIKNSVSGNSAHETIIPDDKLDEDDLKEINDLMELGDDEKENGKSTKEPDNTEFVNAENEDKTEVVSGENEVVSGENEDDPIAGEDKALLGTEECILPDEEEEDGELMEKTKEQYIVTKINETNPQECLECNKKEAPKYSCKVGEKLQYICNEDCLKVLKEKKAGQIIIRDLRVKTFAVVDSLPTSENQPESPSPGEEADNLCGYCKKIISNDLYFNCNCTNFCTTDCLSSYYKDLGSTCHYCSKEVPETLLGKYSVRFGTEIKQFCQNTCLLQHKRGQRSCVVCQGVIHTSGFLGFCSLTCHNISKNIVERAICAVCKVKKIQKITYEDAGKIYRFCGKPCFLAYRYVNNVNPVQCEFCKKSVVAENLPHHFWHLGRKYQLCTEECKKLLITRMRKIVNCVTCNVKKYDFDMISVYNSNERFTVCSVNCYNIKKNAWSTSKEIKCDYCKKKCFPQFHIRTLDGVVHDFCSTDCLKQFKDGLNKSQLETPSRKVKQIVVVKPRQIPAQRNMATMCKPNMVTKAISCRPKEATKSCQTEPSSNKFIVPIPVPIFVPIPVGMFSKPIPCPFPLPIPIPVPIFIPTTRNSIKGIQKEIDRIRNKTPANPLEAELLMMAEMVAEDKQDPTDSESDNEVPPVQKTESPHEEEEPVDPPNFGEDVIQMALKMATDFDESEDLEGGIVTPNEDDTQRIEAIMETKRRSIRQGRGKREDVDKPDANMCLKYTFGVNAWKQWVAMKNLELQKSSKKGKPFKSEILHATADELNYCLCLFVNEVRKPNGSEYAPDTIYYLCLGIQQYLYENGRIDNIFCDSFYEKFTDCLQEVCQKFSILYNESQYIVTRVEEEHLWECKQLGAHSPLVLLNTLMFFNTKHFGLTTVEEHLQLSFSHIMKHWKRNPSQPGSRSVLLRFYPPQVGDKPRKKRVHEQQENEINPIRCPVKLYEFYLSKCPESVKTRNDVFYLQPERSCVPDSPVWYSTMPLEREPLEKMLGRVKMVKEINVAILTS